MKEIWLYQVFTFNPSESNNSKYKKSFLAVIYMTVLEIILQIVNSIFGINGYELEVNILVSFLLKDIANIGLILVFTAWFALIAKMVDKRITLATSLRLTTYPLYTKILLFLFSYINALKPYGSIYLLPFGVLLFTGLLKVTSKKNAIIVFLIAVMLIPAIYLLFVGIDLYSIKSVGEEIYSR